MIGLGLYPTVLLALALLIPHIYSAWRKRESLKSVLLLFVCSMLIVVFYPLTSYLGDLVGFLERATP